MKHPILIIAFLLLPLLCFSQGITFEQGSWKDALVLAKQTNKPLMLYVYFSEDENSRFVYENVIKGVFSSEPVGDVCKMYFVCYKLDASKKEGLKKVWPYQAVGCAVCQYRWYDAVKLGHHVDRWYKRVHGGSQSCLVGSERF